MAQAFPTLAPAGTGELTTEPCRGEPGRVYSNQCAWSNTRRTEQPSTSRRRLQQFFVQCARCIQNSQPSRGRSGSKKSKDSSQPTGVVLIGARWIPGLARPPAPCAVGPNKPHEGSGRQYLAVFLAFGITPASRSTGIVGGCGGTNLVLDHFDEDDVPASEFVTSIRNGHGPCT